MLLFLLLSWCSLSVPSRALDTQDLLGQWQDDHGLFLSINSATNGQLTGIYETTSGHNKKQYIVTGSYDPKGNTLGWTVTWSSPLHGTIYSTTAWSGQYHHEEVPRIETTWIHTSDTSLEDQWESTLIGKGDFLRYDTLDESQIPATYAP